MNENSESLTLALAYRLALNEARNVQVAMIQTARKLRAQTKSSEVYSLLGEFITATPVERMTIVATVEQMFLADAELNQ